ncbi:MAG: polyprenol monophosphomannose synthase [Candidatus Freyarchaeota archaeon]|nr:polyprenol monophosphomannose synthase [Candidatus Jordarchaeia archaeon]
MRLSIIIPTYNERDNLEELAERLRSALGEAKYELVIVDDGSPDGTGKLAEELARRLGNVKVMHRPGKCGLASAVVDGLMVAEGDVVAVMDADLQHPPEILPRMIEEIVKGADLVVASRYVKGGGVEGWSQWRRLVSRVATLMARLSIPRARWVRDPLSGFFAFKRSVVEGLELNPKGFKILLEIIAKGNFRKVVETPYTFQIRRRGESKLKTSEYLNYVAHLNKLQKETIKKALSNLWCTAKPT